jgi:peroxiredoxin
MDTQDEQGSGRPGRRWRIWVERVVMVGVLAFLFYRLGPQLRVLTGVGPNLGKAPDFTMVTLDGDTIHSADLLGDVVLVNFWAAWCGPCKLEMPSLQSAHEDLSADGLRVLGLATDVGSAGNVEAYLRERGIDFPVGSRDPRSTIGLRRNLCCSYHVYHRPSRNHTPQGNRLLHPACSVAIHFETPERRAQLSDHCGTVLQA